ncbi:hypothetical protein NPIL_281401 [Nephila pilipes]|uniref:Uncharacterized protein n=1 Tax=Nephila pilipes TaxID=299642 RepID=A0A8X6QMD0_NEPPI|nr:hypothetical protein NPIL_281401 [Nephila pilipes]
MTTEIEIAKQKRKAARATYSKTVNKLQEILAAESPDVADLEIHLDQLTEKFKDLKTSDEIFLNLLQKKTGITQAEYEKEYEIAQDYYEKLSTFKIKVKKAIASAEKENGSSASPNLTWRPADGAHAATKAKQNLPEIRLPQFDGLAEIEVSSARRWSQLHLQFRLSLTSKYQGNIITVKVADARAVRYNHAKCIADPS